MTDASCTPGGSGFDADPGAAADAAAINASMPTCSQSEFETKVKLGPVGLAGTARMSGSVSVGCQQIAVNVVENTKATKTIHCLVKSKTATLSTEATISQKISVVNFGSITAGNFTIRNKASALIVITNDMTGAEKMMIKQAVATSVNSTLDAIQASTKAQTSNTQGQQSINLAKNAVNNLTNDTSIDNKIATIMTRAGIGQEISLINYGVITGDTFTIENDTVLSLTVQNIMNSTVEAFMELDEVTDYINMMKNDQSAESTTLEGELSRAIVIGIAIIGGILLIFILVSLFRSKS